LWFSRETQRAFTNDVSLDLLAAALDSMYKRCQGHHCYRPLSRSVLTKKHAPCADDSKTKVAGGTRDFHPGKMEN
jgi:hypothetical protein